MLPISWRSNRREGEQSESPLVALRSEMDRLFDTFLREPFGSIDWPLVGQRKWAPTIDIAESDEEAIDLTKQLLPFIPQNCWEKQPLPSQTTIQIEWKKPFSMSCPTTLNLHTTCMRS